MSGVSERLTEVRFLPGLPDGGERGEAGEVKTVNAAKKDMSGRKAQTLPEHHGHTTLAPRSHYGQFTDSVMEWNVGVEYVVRSTVWF